MADGGFYNTDAIVAEMEAVSIFTAADIKNFLKILNEDEDASARPPDMYGRSDIVVKKHHHGVQLGKLPPNEQANAIDTLGDESHHETDEEDPEEEQKDHKGNKKGMVYSNHISVRVTGAHKMYIEQGAHKNSEKVNWTMCAAWDPRTQTETKVRKGYHLEKAETIYADYEACRMLTKAAEGAFVSEDSETMEYLTTTLGGDFGCATEDAKMHFFNIYGFWLGDGWLGEGNIGISQRKRKDIEFISGLLEKIGGNLSALNAGYSVMDTSVTPHKPVVLVATDSLGRRTFSLENLLVLPDIISLTLRITYAPWVKFFHA